MATNSWDVQEVYILEGTMLVDENEDDDNGRDGRDDDNDGINELKKNSCTDLDTGVHGWEC